MSKDAELSWQRGIQCGEELVYRNLRNQMGVWARAWGRSQSWPCTWWFPLWDVITNTVSGWLLWGPEWLWKGWASENSSLGDAYGMGQEKGTLWGGQKKTKRLRVGENGQHFQMPQGSQVWCHGFLEVISWWKYSDDTELIRKKLDGGGGLQGGLLAWRPLFQDLSHTQWNRGDCDWGGHRVEQSFLCLLFKIRLYWQAD